MYIMPARRKAEAEHAEWFAKQLFDDSAGSCIELRFFRAWINYNTNRIVRKDSHIAAGVESRRTVSGWYTREDRLACGVFRADGVSVYMTVNPMKKEGRPERLKDELGYLNAGEGCGIDDVIRIKWVVVDIDPVTAGSRKYENSTQDELDRCVEVANQVRAPAPASSTVGISGNGAFVLVRTAGLENTPESRSLVKRYVKTLMRLHSTEYAAIDPDSGVPSKMISVPGSWKCKAPISTVERPWRIFESCRPMGSYA